MCRSRRAFQSTTFKRVVRDYARGKVFSRPPRHPWPTKALTTSRSPAFKGTTFKRVGRDYARADVAGLAGASEERASGW